MKNLSADIHCFKSCTCSFGSRGIKVVQLCGICYTLIGLIKQYIIVKIQRKYSSRKSVRGWSIHSERRHSTNRRKNKQATEGQDI